ncbi:MAG: hypothetical protein LBM96_00645 [Methanobrevibacter sp.]|jgi:hypothetical protein|nr:hypothetical protein [Candidatus Methanoflexus mossambicus]
MSELNKKAAKKADYGTTIVSGVAGLVSILTLIPENYKWIIGLIYLILLIISQKYSNVRTIANQVAYYAKGVNDTTVKLNESNNAFIVSETASNNSNIEVTEEEI